MLNAIAIFYILMGILVTPGFIVMEEIFHQDLYKSPANPMTVIRTVSYYLLWPIVLIHYFIEIIKNEYIHK